MRLILVVGCGTSLVFVGGSWVAVYWVGGSRAPV